MLAYHQQGSAPFTHDNVIKWKHFPRYWPFVRGIHRSPVNSPHKGQWRGALIFSLICVWINGWVNNREAGDMRRYRAHYDVSVMIGTLALKMLVKVITTTLVKISQDQRHILQGTTNQVWVPSWWRHQMETFFALLAFCAGNSPAAGEFPAQRPVTRNFKVFFDLCLTE